MFLGIDLGTTNIKALLVRPDGRIVARGAAPVALHHVGPAGVEQDIEEIWRATLAAIRQATRAGKGRAVRAVGVSSQGGAMQVLDGAGQPLGRVISWLDGRGHPYDGRLTRRKGSAWFARHTGHGASAVMIGQVLRLRREAPSGLRPPNRVGFVGDVVVARLAGQGAHDASSLSIAMAYNPRERRADPAIL
jgi:sugar (pentulose or hexulose) kinase